mmetsp:Transcript_33679/g.71322  ORF Transcript_33679/g.71322 Transcript_33679/m.71322 type:complete len:660 (-) Transcript_33679:58-2037(-)
MRVACFLAGVVAASAAEVTPVQKVIQLMNGMLEKGKKEKHEEQVQFAAYKQFCDDTSVEKARAIKEASEQIESLEALIGKCEATIEKRTKEIAQLDEDISVYEGDLKATTAVRKMEHNDYQATHKDYTESVDALTAAIAIIKKKAYDRKQAASMLLQVKQDLVPAHARRVLDAFLATTETAEDVGLDVSAPEANAYESHSGGIIDMLEKLKDKFEDERSELEKEESNAKHAHEMLSQDLTNSISTSKEDRHDKAQEKAKTAQREADAKGDLQDTVSSRDSDQEYLDDLNAECKSKSDDFEARQTLRAQEIEAIEKAIEIISSGAVSGAADKHLPSLAQVSLIQLRSKATAPVQAKVAMYLQERAKMLNSRVLSALAVRVSDDPFKQVKKMIKDLIVRLLEEANEEAEQKGWCDTELSTNEQTRKEKTEAVEGLHAEIDETEASIAKLTKELGELSTQIQELDAAVAKATTLRNDEKAKNEETIKDSKEAQVAVEQALQVLKDFYAKAGEATALVQQEPPEIFDKPYQGMGGESGGVIGMLEVIQSDFARLETETKAAESQAQAVYDKFTEDSSVDKAAKQKDVEYKSNKKESESEELLEMKADLESTQKELDAALRYYEKLKPSCVDAGVSYEERVARRKEEIESLQEALRILNGEDIA